MPPSLSAWPPEWVTAVAPSRPDTPHAAPLPAKLNHSAARSAVAAGRWRIRRIAGTMRTMARPAADAGREAPALVGL